MFQYRGREKVVRLYLAWRPFADFDELDMRQYYHNKTIKSRLFPVYFFVIIPKARG